MHLPGIRFDLTSPVEPLVGEGWSLKVHEEPREWPEFLDSPAVGGEVPAPGLSSLPLTSQSEGCGKEDSWPLLGMCLRTPAASLGEDLCHLRISY